MRVLKKKKLIPAFLVLVSLSFITSCGSDDDDDGALPPVQEVENQEDAGTYEAVLNPLNITEGTSPSGTVRIVIRGDEFIADADVEDTQALSLHPQYVYTGNSCPSVVNDSNGDGYIDFPESLQTTSSILIPLDNNLSTQSSGSFPLSDFSGDYDWDESASLSRIYSDLRSPDPAPNDEVVKLPEGEDLNLAGKVVVVHGIRTSTDLPDSVSGSGTASPQRVLPVACGVLQRVASPPSPPVPTPTPDQECPEEEAFNTRLSTELAIDGQKCRGGEPAQRPNEDGTSQIYVCEEGQWLVRVDNVNTCTPDGICTEIGVFPVIVELDRAGTSNPPEQCTFDFDPVIPVDDDEEEILNTHQVRFFDEEAPQIIRK